MPTWALSLAISALIKLLGATVLDKAALTHLMARATQNNNKLEVGAVKAMAATLGVQLDDVTKPVV